METIPLPDSGPVRERVYGLPCRSLFAIKMYSPKGTFGPRSRALHLTCLFPISGTALKASCSKTPPNRLTRPVLQPGLPPLCQGIGNTGTSSANHKEFRQLRDSRTGLFHDECYATYKSWAPAYGIEVPFKPVHLFHPDRQVKRNRSAIKKLGFKVAYQRPCSTRLVPETEPMLMSFELIGVDRVPPKYDRKRPLLWSHQSLRTEELADEINKY